MEAFIVQMLAAAPIWVVILTTGILLLLPLLFDEFFGFKPREGMRNLSAIIGGSLVALSILVLLVGAVYRWATAPRDSRALDSGEVIGPPTTTPSGADRLVQAEPQAASPVSEDGPVVVVTSATEYRVRDVSFAVYAVGMMTFPNVRLNYFFVDRSDDRIRVDLTSCNSVTFVARSTEVVEVSVTLVSGQVVEGHLSLPTEEELPRQQGPYLAGPRQMYHLIAVHEGEEKEFAIAATPRPISRTETIRRIGGFVERIMFERDDGKS